MATIINKIANMKMRRVDKRQILSGKKLSVKYKIPHLEVGDL